ncbi:hypothetical protein [Ollibium composti]|uniref:Uncharacterized protein n=1 Tax=Ollibium composti TaxID=2675109 RepID=A0ABY2QCL6_9HYPH|nr:hypothetical protein [Mesorhizobium composti]THF59658.1 hypothetical protein E6C48_00915 [Mesorhizobium composti]
MLEQDWDRFERWHRLLDELCNRRGHIDNALLASQLCRRQGRNGQDEFNAAGKSLRNWRLGRHVPLRRNFMLLSELLDVPADPELSRHWNRLYATARGHVPLEDSEGPAVDPTAPLPARSARGRLVWAAAALVAVLVAAGLRWLMVDPHKDLPMIGYQARVDMLVGETRLIHGDRGNCDGTMVPGWNKTAPRVPESRLGSFSDGGLARKMSNFCNAVVPVRAVKFTAREPGAEEVMLLEDFMKIVVRDYQGSRLE